MSTSVIILIIVGVALLFGIILYNRLVALRLRRTNAFADIDVQLKLRSDLVPNLVETVKGYATHESGIFTAVTEARAAASKASNPQERIAAENALGMALTNLMAVAENYPDLKANTNFLDLQRELADIENKIAAARRFFNNATNEYNASVQQFPSVLVARMFNFHEEAFFDVGTENRAVLEQGVKVSFN